MKTLKTDCLVIGAGLAGAAYGYFAGRKGLRCVLISNDSPRITANSDLAQGGIIFHKTGDTEQLAEEMMRASDGTANPEAVESLLLHGPSTVQSFLLEDLKIPFDRADNGNLKFTREGGHSHPRIIYAKDATGHAILKAARKRMQELERVEHIEGFVAIDLLTLSHSSVNQADRFQPLTCIGAYVLDKTRGKVMAILAKKTVLATGGLGRIFSVTTNQPGTYGHGIAMAYRIGARLMDLEYIQFHPTAFYKKGVPPFLISETLRGEGGVLINAAGEPFMDDLHPLKSLAPRDFVSRAIYRELARRGDDCVYLDMTPFEADFLRQRFPNIYRCCLEKGVDISLQPIPVAPAAHYLCGGVYTDLKGRTSVRNLNAIGETAGTGLHGANRLASTSLLECITSAKLAAEADFAEIANSDFYLPDVKTWINPTAEADTTLIKQDLNLIKNTMIHYVGIVRTLNRLQRAGKILRELKSEIDDFYSGYKINEPMVNLRNAVQTALLVVHAAILNRHCKGSHFRSDEASLEPERVAPPLQPS